MFIMVVAFLCLAEVCCAQSVQPLKVGDRFPEMIFTNLINAPYSAVPYNKLKDKVVVLDFFSTWCSSCLALFPHLDSLKAKYGKQLEIFIVTREPREKVEKMLKTKAIAKGFKLPFIVEDTVLNALFPHSTIPHEVILKDAVVAAITFSEFINDNTIEKLLAGDQIDLPVKSDIRYDPAKSVYGNNVGSPNELSIWKFLFTKHIDGLSSVGGWSISADSLRKRFARVNNFLLYYMTWASDMMGNKNRVILHVKDSSKFFITGSSEYAWKMNNTYGMEIVIPASWSWSRVYSWVLGQLNMCLNYRIYTREQLVDCWVLSDSENRLVGPDNETREDGKSARIYKSLASLISALNFQAQGKPFVPIVINEVKGTYIEEIRLNVDNIHDPVAVSRALKPYGLELKPAKRKLKMLIIEDKEADPKTGNRN